MCEQCGEPERTAGQRYLSEVLDRIREYGWCVQGVLGTGVRPPWAYTLGLTAHGLPELVVTGLPPHPSAVLLSAAAERTLTTGPPEPGARLSLPGHPALEAVALTAPGVHLHFAVALYGPEISAIQLVHSDVRGVFPWSPNYRAGQGGQPVLGERTHD
ncbi:DUF4262 domain-containing protein [Amycolatopsis jiangsuensis]|uniref:DUF4262 domain-containing protein n=1 Tax=Amycolatopsis jiangsuensis TaxID=1181879 RepID=A0A840J455_9PSEU|nr:DUF4262 domain-containing protein [Amycolatopsis jiangsuensis]MBB4688643.1 hypothetical protein [Amycolatopsis jiangsuensis]